MYNYGLVKFLQAKKLKSNECINAFLLAEGITDFSAKHHNRVNDYINNNWNKFSSFVDKGIKDGTIKGIPVKLNTFFDEKRAYIKAVNDEFEKANLTAEQKRLLNEIKLNGVGKLQSVMMKAGFNPVGKNLGCKSKTLQWLPIVNQAIENGILI